MRECNRCLSITGKEKRCKRTTCKTANHCYQHLISEFGLRVKESGIQGAGMGLYTTRDVSINSNICAYAGDILSLDELDRRYPDDDGVYVLQLTKNTSIDARSTQSCLGRYANSCDNSADACNVRFSKYRGVVSLKATKNISANTELLIKYGRDYWQ